ncbi:MAG: UDP-2,3-diacylglucosamine diphosphatase [Candidatus Electryonea clarkiae]|nr:UDP-2,3-diacylglucosamine diphosphatase [Candidatus Electryonea clarkiae]MDP8286852.1 UDP-2,3-diacylglucosamine diphosphatase [Candidatus Electryonea clarkiae]
MYAKKTFQTSPNSRVLIIGDAHLPLDKQEGGAASIEHFRQLIKYYKDSLTLLVLLGDIFDFWYEWRHVIPKRATGLLYDLHDIALKGVPIHYFAGNHDFKLTGYLEKEIGMKIHLDEWITEIDGKRIFFHHGDGFAAGDINYRRMKKVFRNPIAQFLFGTILHPDLSMILGRISSNAGVHNRKNYVDRNPPIEEYHKAAGKILAGNIDVVIFGHTHRTEHIEFEQGIYHNPGPFQKKMNYSLIENGLLISKVWK